MLINLNHLYSFVIYYYRNNPMEMFICHAIIIIFMILIIIIVNIKCVETYDAKMSFLTLAECGTQCTEGSGCVGFGYKPSTGECYLSRDGILGRPYNSLYEDEYSRLDKRCNKINKISDSDRIDENTLTQNSVYLCSDGENNVSSQYQFANYGASSLEPVGYTIFDKSDGDILAPTGVIYPTRHIEWPSEKRDLLPGFLTEDDLSETDEQETIKYGFVESDKEFLGQYALSHQCVTNVPLYDCLKYCEQNIECAGVEWNKGLIKFDGNNNQLYENVCCPKKIIAKVIPRRKQFNRGRFYVKKDMKDLGARDNIIITRTNVDSKTPPINNRFSLDMTNISNCSDDPDNQDISNVRGTLSEIFN